MPATDAAPDLSSPPPAPLTASSLPSSFDDTDFFQESRFQKFTRKIRQEPLIPLGCLATCWALYQASKSIRAGTPVRTNAMFRARIYAQGFTLVAIVAGGVFYKDERMQRRKFENSIEEKKQGEKREKWLKELEARDQEDRTWREGVEKEQLVVSEMELERNKQRVAENEREMDLKRVPEKGLRRVSEETKKVVEANFPSKSVMEERSREWWVWRTREAWRRM